MKYLVFLLILAVAVTHAVFASSSSDKKSRVRRFWKDLSRNVLLAFAIYYAFFISLYFLHR